MRLSVVLHITGTLTGLFGPASLLAAAVAGFYREWRDLVGFLVACVVTVGLGAWMRRAGGPTAGDVQGLRRVEGMAVVSFTWLIVVLLATIPFIVAGLSFVDAFFESMSALTATGSTVLVDFAAYGRSIFFWRALTHWLGGLGVIALVVAVLPRLAIGGRELFFAEAPGPTDEKLTPQLRHTALALWRVYTVLTVAMIVALAAAGMPLFDALCNALATLAAGGLSPNPQSIAGYDSAAIEWIVTVFMFAAGANFALQYRAVRGSREAITQDEEFRAYCGIILVATVVLFVLLVRDGFAPGESIRHAAFQVTSILTTTGFASVDFQLWSDQARMVLFVLMFIGSCAGSAGGGPKVVRHLLMARYTLRELRRTLHPRGVLPVKLGGVVVPESTLRDIQVFMLFYLLTFAVGAAVVVAMGADLITGITASIASLGNVGPGFGSVGPMSNFAGLHPVSKVVLSLEMWIGRLEVLTVLVFFRAEAWRTARWSAT